MSKVVRYQLQIEAKYTKNEYLNVGQTQNVESLLDNTVYSLKSIIKAQEPSSLGNLDDSSIELWQTQHGILIQFDEFSTVNEIVDSTRENKCPILVRYKGKFCFISVFYVASLISCFQSYNPLNPLLLVCVCLPVDENLRRFLCFSRFRFVQWKQH